jgi:hypothetical protein
MATAQATMAFKQMLQGLQRNNANFCLCLEGFY